MSGGSYGYAYSAVLEMADKLDSVNQDPLRRAFGRHLRRVGRAMHDIEWVDSGDYGSGDEIKSIEAVLDEKGKQEAWAILIEDANKMIQKLQELSTITKQK